jgi:hypothetical protein
LPDFPPISLQERSRGRLLHILATSALAGDEVLVHFSDGSSAIYEMEELEKLRPTPKKVYAAGAPERPADLADVA